jgi:TIGR03009 family protein
MVRILGFLSLIGSLTFISALRAQQTPAPSQPRGAASPVGGLQGVGTVAPSPGGGPGAAAPTAPLQPEWVARMTLAEQQWVDEVLRYWEARSEKVKLFECRFQRWDYEGGPAEVEQGRVVRRHPRTYAEGTIKYAQPDKGLYRVEKLAIASVTEEGGKPQYVAQNPELGEHWICDGEKIYSFEASKKQVTVTPLPPELRGQAIVDGPLPFLFGAKAETIKARYWVRGLVPAPDDKSKENKYWLEAVPKSRQDAQNFKAVRIVLDKEQFLPESLEIFAPHYDPPRNDARQTYLFSKRQVKDANTIADSLRQGLDPLGLFTRDFYEVRIPLGWKKVEQREPAAVGPPAASPVVVPQQAQGAPPASRQGAVSR